MVARSRLENTKCEGQRSGNTARAEWAAKVAAVVIEMDSWLRARCGEYHFDLRGVFRARGSHAWPVQASGERELEALLASGGHLLALPKEPAALANVLEVSIADFLLDAAAHLDGAVADRGTERGYPDIEFNGPAFGGGYYAVDIKIARRGMTKAGTPKTSTQSRITLYTGNTYFRYPTLHWPGTFRPFNDYTSHLDVIGVYTLNEQTDSRVDDLELIVQPAWCIASKRRSSTTREYIGAVQQIADLREAHGEFPTPEAFYRYWRKYPFRIGRVVQQQLDKLLAGQQT